MNWLRVGVTGDTQVFLHGFALFFSIENKQGVFASVFLTHRIGG